MKIGITGRGMWRAGRWLAVLILALAPRAQADPLAHTYSIVARDPETGNLGVAVQSHWFQVGPVVPWAEAGVGAVATQSFVRVDYGPRGLELMRQGRSAEEALQSLLGKDEQRDVRQVAMVDASGATAVWTGPRCIAEAGHRRGEGYTVQANLMARDTVWDAMATAYEASDGDFAERLLAALEAAEAEGGDIRGRQSAALLIVRAESTGKPWEDRLVDLRVDDHREPLTELRRLLGRHRAYEEMNAGDEAVALEDYEAAAGHYTRAAELAPDIVEIPFWQAVTLFAAGREERALEIFEEVFRRDSRWLELVPRLPASGLLPDDAEKLGRVLSRAPERRRAPAAEPAKGPPEAEEGWVRIDGTLTGEGVECPLLRGDDGRAYSLAGNLGEARPGDRIRVEGPVAQVSICMQGTTISVRRWQPLQ